MEKMKGGDAATMKPRLIPDDELHGRDDSGGLYFDAYTQQFDDGGYVTGGNKPHLSVGSGGMKKDPTDSPSKMKGGAMLRRSIGGDNTMSDGDVD